MKRVQRRQPGSILAHIKRYLANKGLCVVSQSELERLERQAAKLPVRRVIPLVSR